MWWVPVLSLSLRDSAYAKHAQIFKAEFESLNTDFFRYTKNKIMSYLDHIRVA